MASKDTAAAGVAARAERRAPKRDGARTRQQILSAAIREFSQHGYNGARIERIVDRAKCNMRMVYHHFKSKNGLYIAVLEAVYLEIRSAERALDLEHLAPIDAMKRLIEFTVDHFAAHPDFVRLTSTENLQKGKFIKASRRIPTMSSPLIETLRTVLARGEAMGQFRPEVDPLQLYISIVALSCHHLNNSYTLSATFQTDVRSREWQANRKRQVCDMVLAYLFIDQKAA